VSGWLGVGSESTCWLNTVAWPSDVLLNWDFRSECLPGREAALYPAANGGGAVFDFDSSPLGRFVWGKPL
jgi:hypothetical protein